ncbi:WD40-repeat-containing domain protein [Pisolithus marmoratus]|nr:WD40-repeat-containing domain protein [Pisolithus marmoratus]
MVADPKQHTLNEGAVPQDRARTERQSGEPNSVNPWILALHVPVEDDVLCQIDNVGGRISSLVFLADRKHVVCAYKAEKMIQIWNIENRGDRKPLMNSGVAVNVIASSKDGNFFVTGGVDGKVIIWDTSLQKICEAPERHGKVITALDASSLHAASGSNDGTVRVWKLGTLGFPVVPAPLMRHGSISVSSVKFSPTGRHIASASARWDCSAKIWHTQTWAHIESIRIRPPTHSLAWSSDGRRLFAGCANGSINYSDTITQKHFSKAVEPRPGDDSITSLRVSNSDQLLVSFSAPGRTVDSWDIPSLEVTELSLFLPPSPSFPESLRASYMYQSHSVPELEAGRTGASRSTSCRGKSKTNDTSISLAMLALTLWMTLERSCYGQTNGAQIPPIAHIAKAIALIRQGKQRDSMAAFGSVDFGGAKDFVDCVKSVILFQVELDKIDCETELAELSPLEDACSCPWIKARKSLLLAEHCVQRGEYNEGLRLLAEVPDLGQIPEAKILPLIFGWDIYDLEHRVQEVTCQALFASGRTQEVRDLIRVNENRLDEENEARKADPGGHAEKLGDEAMCHKQYDDAITWYSFSLDLCPESRVIDRGSATVADAAVAKDLTLTPGSARLLVKRSKAKAFKEFWNEALEDADQVKIFSASFSRSIRIICVRGGMREDTWQLHALQRYEEAAETFSEMVTKMKESAEPSIRELEL